VLKNLPFFVGLAGRASSRRPVFFSLRQHVARRVLLNFRRFQCRPELGATTVPLCLPRLIGRPKIELLAKREFANFMQGKPRPQDAEGSSQA
jgi:hypothetical protein